MNGPQVKDTQVQLKPWGLTKCVHRDTTHEIWHASIKKGGFSSRHTHDRKANLFYVASGTLRVHVFRARMAPIPITTYELKPGQQIIIDDGVWHQFEAALDDVELIEVYWVHLKGEDITRADEGGLR